MLEAEGPGCWPLAGGAVPASLPLPEGGIKAGMELGLAEGGEM